MSRILAIDFGDRRIGVAISDPLGMFAIGIETIDTPREKERLSQLSDYCKQYDVIKIIAGLPKHMNGTEGEAVQKVRHFVSLFETAGITCPVEFLDERLTSVIAQQTLKAQGVKASRNKGLVDQAAAMLILQNYLDKTS